MNDEPHDRRHNGGPLSEDDGRKLWNHIRALEAFDEQLQETRDDRKTRKNIAKAQGFDPNILEAMVKRRKIGAGETRQADNLVQLYEEALAELGVQPLEETRKAREAGERRTLEQIDEDLHGEEPEGDGPDRTMFN